MTHERIHPGAVTLVLNLYSYGFITETNESHTDAS